MNDAQFTGTSADQKPAEILIDREFPAAVIGDGKINYTPSFGFVEQSLTLQSPPRNTLIKQRERPIETLEFTQGHDGDLKEEEFLISDLGKVDVLVVVDNSGSMQDEQDKLKNKLSALTKHLSTTDWRIAVITTDSSCLAGGKIIAKGSMTADADFAAAIAAGTSGSADEKGVKQAQLALKGECPTGRFMWLRNDASIAVLFVTDENNTCKEFAPDPCEVGNRPGELVATLKSLRGDRARAYGLTWKNGESGCTNPNGESDGLRYEEVINNTGGFRGSICASDYTATLERISRDVARNVRYEFNLGYTPIPSETVVTIDGLDYKDYDLSGRQLRLKNILGTENKLKITYRHDAVPKLNHFPLGPAAGDSIEVWINGISVDATLLSFDEVSQDLSLSEIPPDRASIKVKYRLDQSLDWQFDLSSNPPTETPHQVLIDGNPTNDFAYDDVTRVLSFSNPPADGAEIKVLWYDHADDVTAYPLSGYDADTLKQLRVRDATSSEPIPFVFEDGILSFSDIEIVHGRVVVITFDYGDYGDTMTLMLPFEPMPGSVSIKAMDSNINCVETLTIVGNRVDFACPGDGQGQVEISYRYILESLTKFDVGPIPSGAAFRFQVFINDVITTRFEQQGSVVQIPPELLTPDAKVRIVVTKS